MSMIEELKQAVKRAVIQIEQEAVQHYEETGEKRSGDEKKVLARTILQPVVAAFLTGYPVLEPFAPLITDVLIEVVLHAFNAVGHNWLEKLLELQKEEGN